MMRELPRSETLRDAVKEVIRSNRADGYPPTRFIQATQGGDAPDLKGICERLILNPDTLTWLVEAVSKHRSLLFLEDLVTQHGYGLTKEAIEEAERRSRALDDLVGNARWSKASVGMRPSANPSRANGGERSGWPQVARKLLKLRETREGDYFWPWLEELSGRPAEKRTANKFILGCILDWQIPADRAWGNAERLAEDILGDPQDLWEEIGKVSLSAWMSKFSTYSLHRFRKGHERVWTIAKKLASQYAGDARKIWIDQRPEVVIVRLQELGVGEQISRMIVGALIDTGQITGLGDVKLDRHVCRVLGRILQGAPFIPDSAIRAARGLWPANPWLLDRPLYLIGKEFCFATNPNCAACYLRSSCEYAKRE